MRAAAWWIAPSRLASLTLLLTMGGYAASDECVENFDAAVDYFPEKVALRHARSFAVEYRSHYKVLTVTDSTLAPGAPRDVVVLVQCGTPVPELVDELAGATVVQIPVASIAANEDLSLYRSWLLGASDRVVGVGGEGIYTPELRARWDDRQVEAIGESFHGPPNYERLLDLRPGVVFLSTASLARSGAIARARALGIPAVPSLSWSELTPLGQAEWVHHVALFLNAEAASNTVFDGIESRYLELSEAAKAQPKRPQLLWFDPGGQRDRWQVPEANWIARLVSDAGGRTPWADFDGDLTRLVTSEDILLRAAELDYLVTVTVALAEPDSAGVLERLPALRQGRLYDVHRRSIPENDAYDWYESAVVEVDRVLADLVALLHPPLMPSHQFLHLRPARPGSNGRPADGK